MMAKNATLEKLLLHAQIGSAIMADLNAQNLLLHPSQDNPAIVIMTHIPSLLPFHVKDVSAIIIRTHVNFKLQLIVVPTQRALIKLIVNFISGSEGKYAPTNLWQSKLIVTIETGVIALAHCLNLHVVSEELIVICSKIFLHFRKDQGTCCEREWEQQ
jgi:hypothetical protein